MKLRDDVQVHEKKPKIHLVPPLYKDPRKYCALYQRIYDEICDTLNGGVDIGTYICGVDGMYLLYGEILDENGRSIDGEVRNGKIYRGQIFQMAIVCDGRVSFGSHGYKENSILREGRSERPQEPIEEVDEQSLSILEDIASEYNFRVVSEFIEPFFQEKYLPDVIKNARQNPQRDKFSWMYEDRDDVKSGLKQTNGTPSYVKREQREATQVYKK